jgi:hypothetical protein
MDPGTPARPDEPFAVTVVIPCLNEEDNIEAVYAAVTAELGRYDDVEILFVDDGSTDGSLELIRGLAKRDPAVRYLSFTRNFGLEPAFSAGYRYARHPWILHLDADLQFPPDQAHRLIARAADGFDAVFGVRVDRRDRWIRRAASRLHDLIARRMLAIDLPPGATTFRLVRSDLARRIVDLDLGTPYFLATLPRLTRAWTTVPIAHRARSRGSAKVTVRGLARHALELFFSFSPRPMTFAGLACLTGAVLALGAAIAPLAGADRVALSLAGTALLAGLLALAVMARHLVHIARAQPGLPRYVIREANVDVRPADLLGATRPQVRVDIPRAAGVA